jgi:hypothetical protein
MPAESPEPLNILDAPSRMFNAKWPPWLVLLALAGAAAAQNGDPLRSPACLQALAALMAEEQAAPASAAGSARVHGDSPSTVRILARRKFAAGTCLGAWMDASPQASRAFQPPVQVSPVSSPIPRPQPTVNAAPPAMRPARPAQQSSIVSCDIGGCLTSDGARLPRVGGMLLGPNGLCSAQMPGQVCP